MIIANVALGGIHAIKCRFNVDARWGHALWRYHFNFALQRLQHVTLMFHDAHAKFKPDLVRGFTTGFPSW